MWVISAFKKNRIGKTYVLGATLFSALFVFLILFTLIINSSQAIFQVGPGILGLTWDPPRNRFGVLSMIFGSLSVSLIALCIAVPLGVATAIFTSELMPRRFRFLAKSLLEMLAGIPSIVYGLIGVAFFSLWIQNFFALSSGRTIFTGGILIAIMILPTLITLVDDALFEIPGQYREAARGLGLYKGEVIRGALLPIARGDIIGAVLLSLGRALGETMAVMLVIGSIDKIPAPFYNLLVPGQTITSKLGREMAETSFGSLHFSAMIFMGLILLLITLGLTLAAWVMYKPGERLYE